MALVTILLHFPCTRVHSHFVFKNTAGQISILAKPEIRIKYLSFLPIRKELELPYFRTNLSNWKTRFI